MILPILGDNPLEVTPPETTFPTEYTPWDTPDLTRGPDHNRPTTWGSDYNPNPNRPTGRELSENWH